MGTKRPMRHASLAWCCKGSCYALGFIISSFILSAMFWIFWCYIGLFPLAEPQRRGASVHYAQSNKANGTSTPDKTFLEKEVRNATSGSITPSVSQSQPSTPTRGNSRRDSTQEQRRPSDPRHVDPLPKDDFPERTDLPLKDKVPETSREHDGKLDDVIIERPSSTRRDPYIDRREDPEPITVRKISSTPGLENNPEPPITRTQPDDKLPTRTESRSKSDDYDDSRTRSRIPAERDEVRPLVRDYEQYDKDHLPPADRKPFEEALPPTRPKDPPARRKYEDDRDYDRRHYDRDDRDKPRYDRDRDIPPRRRYDDDERDYDERPRRRDDGINDSRRRDDVETPRRRDDGINDSRRRDDVERPRRRDEGINDSRRREDTDRPTTSSSSRRRYDDDEPLDSRRRDNDDRLPDSRRRYVDDDEERRRLDGRRRHVDDDDRLPDSRRRYDDDDERLTDARRRYDSADRPSRRQDEDERRVIDSRRRDDGVRITDTRRRDDDDRVIDTRRRDDERYRPTAKRTRDDRHDERRDDDPYRSSIDADDYYKRDDASYRRGSVESEALARRRDEDDRYKDDREPRRPVASDRVPAPRETDSRITLDREIVKPKLKSDDDFVVRRDRPRDDRNRDGDLPSRTDPRYKDVDDDEDRRRTRPRDDHDRELSTSKGDSRVVDRNRPVSLKEDRDLSKPLSPRSDDVTLDRRSYDDVRSRPRSDPKEDDRYRPPSRRVYDDDDDPKYESTSRDRKGDDRDYPVRDTRYRDDDSRRYADDRSSSRDRRPPPRRSLDEDRTRDSSISRTPGNIREKRYQQESSCGNGSNNCNIQDMQSSPKDAESRERPLTSKEVIEAAFRHEEILNRPAEVAYPVYNPSVNNVTSHDLIRPSERRGITIGTRRRKK